MKFTKQDLLTMLIGLFLFSSCKDNNTIGLSPDGSTITGDLYENTSLTSQTVVDDPVSGVGLSRFPIGLMNDPVFGKTEAGTAMTVNIPSTGYRFGIGVEVDSAVLVLPYSKNFYGDSTQSFTFTVKQMDVDLSLQSSFLTSVDWGAKTITGANGLLGESINHQQRPTTPFKVTNIVTGKPDTAATVAPQLRIRLDAQKIQNRIVNLDTSAYSRNDLFVRNFNGLYVNVTSASGSGAMSFFNLAAPSDGNADNGAKLQIYYRKAGTVALTRDTVSAIFPINSTTAPIAASVKHDYSNATAIKTQLDNPSATAYSKTYVQGLTGLKNKISFDFSGFKALLGGSKVSINKAELVIDVTPEDDTYFKPAPRLRLARLNAAGLLVNVPDNDRSVTNSSPAYYGDLRALQSPILFGGYFDSVNRRYIFSITAYIQDLVDGKTQDYGTFISPASNLDADFSVSPFATTAERSILLSPIKDAASGTKRMKLNIFYTKLK
ncbi:DUF4270 domain-containing protein [Pedobacter gandavensis]|uniref:DUF4270 family protein n=1 Tax=Pedobacter gandavensis TaxID=2679963 RepID=A0ABR6F093_9SPHI|nr:DUF4270 domain-containing protein [Pedobacter gandavensis]MBB2150960.1 DUF4270 family protein [Pedobacter gandavensis]